MKFVEDAKLKFGVWNRERKERAEAKKADHQDPANVTIPLSLVRSAKLAAWMAYFSLVYFLWLYTLDIARDRAASLHLTHVGGWIGDIQFYFPYIVGFAVVAIGIPYVAKIAIPTFMSLSWRGNFWPKLWALFIAMAVSLVVIAGTFTVQGDTIMERDRDAAVAVENVQNERAVLEARIASREAELRSMMENRNAYLAQAASVGAAEWQRSYIDQTSPSDPQRERIVRALGAARSADAVRADIQSLREQAARSTAVASVQGEIVTERTGWIADTLGWLEGVRAILLSLVMDIVCLIMPWIALRLEQARNRQMGVESSGWAPEGFRIEDLRDEEPIAKNPVQMQTVMEEEDLATGEKKRMIKPKPYWRTVKKGKKQRIEVPPEMVEDENGAYTDGGKRTAVTLGGAMELPESVAQEEPQKEPEGRAGETGDDQEVASFSATGELDPVTSEPQPEPPISDDDAALALQELASIHGDVSVQDDADVEQADQASQQTESETLHQETSEREEPETRESHMLPNVAAE